MSEQAIVEVKKIQINKYLKNFFFMAFRARKEFKGLEKIIGKIQQVTIIISPGAHILRVQGKDDKKDIPWTEEEMKKFLTNLKIKQESIDESKSIFVMGDWNTQEITIRQNRKDGTKKDFII